jgi:hypothetical protein
MPTERPSGADRRTELRRAAEGEVDLCQSFAPGAPGVPFVGRLLDIAASGFRARHHRFALCSGELVDFAFEGRRGLARAVWTRIVDDEVETGFRICPECSSLGSTLPASSRASPLAPKS